MFWTLNYLLKKFTNKKVKLIYICQHIYASCHFVQIQFSFWYHFCCAWRTLVNVPLSTNLLQTKFSASVCLRKLLFPFIFWGYFHCVYNYTLTGVFFFSFSALSRCHPITFQLAKSPWGKSGCPNSNRERKLHSG